MKNNEFFRALCKQKKHSKGENDALSAWNWGKHYAVNFPILQHYIVQEDVPEFLDTLVKGGYKKFGLPTSFTSLTKDIITFLKAGWKITGVMTFTYNEDHDSEALIFEKD